MDKSEKVAALQTAEETPPVASATLAPDFDGYLFAITMDSSWNDTLCPLVSLPTALARRRANTTPMSQGLSVFLLIDSGSAGTGYPHDWCSNIRLQRRTRPWSIVAKTMCSSPLRGARAWVQLPSVERAIPDRVCSPFNPSKRLAANEAEAEQEAVQIRVRKTPMQPTEEQIMKHNAMHLPFRDWCVPCIAGKAPDWPHSRSTHSSTAVPMCQLDCFFLNCRRDTDILTVLNFLHCPSGASLVQCCDKGLATHVIQAVTTFMDFLASTN